MSCGAAGGLLGAKKRRKLTLFNDRYAEYDIIKHSASFCQHFVLFLSPKRSENTHIYAKMA